jgi:hypothetical protein
MPYELYDELSDESMKIMSYDVFFFYLGFLTRCEFYLDRFLTRQPLHQLKIINMCSINCDCDDLIYYDLICDDEYCLI